MTDDRNLNRTLGDLRWADMITNVLIVVGTVLVIYFFPSQAVEALQTLVEGPVLTISGALSPANSSPGLRILN